MLTIACVKVGEKYNSEHVNTIYRQCKEQFSIPHKFVCYTDNSAGLDPAIEPIWDDKYKHITGSWSKMLLFAPGLLTGAVLYLDLGIVLPDDCPSLQRYLNAYYIKVLRTKRTGTDTCQYDTSIMLFDAGKTHHFWNKFIVDANNIVRKYKNLDHYLWYKCNQSVTYLPDVVRTTKRIDTPIEEPKPQKRLMVYSFRSIHSRD